MESLNSTYKNMPCDVYFFRSWSTYSHPVTPTDPMEYEHALKRDGYYRAWMCKKNNEKLFIYFEGIELDKKLTDIKKPSNTTQFFTIDSHSGKISKGGEIKADETLSFDSFLVSLDDKSEFLTKVEQKSVISYEYVYRSDGGLEKVIIKDFDGNLRELQY